jgi:ABC-type polysaccharide/polyol phosphate transport system ATPase subunit
MVAHQFFLKLIILNLFDFRKNRAEVRYVSLADNLSFSFKEGDRVGILGRNGAGKSTLLKIICGIYPPDRGTVKVQGSIFPLIELGAGFHPDLTGEENVYLYGGLCGISKKTIDKVIDEIFAIMPALDI